jgi:hypothetical protein
MVVAQPMIMAPAVVMVGVPTMMGAPAPSVPKARPYFADANEPKTSQCDCMFCDGGELDGVVRSIQQKQGKSEDGKTSYGYQPFETSLCGAPCKNPLCK